MAISSYTPKEAHARLQQVRSSARNQSHALQQRRDALIADLSEVAAEYRALGKAEAANEVLRAIGPVAAAFDRRVMAVQSQLEADTEALVDIMLEGVETDA